MNAESNLLTLRCWTCVLKVDQAARFVKCTNLRCRLCQRDSLTLCHFPPPLAREMLATHLRGRHKRSADGKTQPWIVCTDCAFPLCWTGCGQRTSAPSLGPLTKPRMWFCATCEDRLYTCLSCNRTWPHDQISTPTLKDCVGNSFVAILCHTCALPQAEFQKWAGKPCSSCDRRNLSLRDFEPVIAKEITEQKRFKWGWKPRICFTCKGASVPPEPKHQNI